MRAPPVVRGGAAVRWASLVLGLLLFAAGIVAILESKLGLSPWDVLNQGVSRHTPLSFGQANIAIALVVLVAGWALRAPIGWGTVANAILIGFFVDQLLRIGWVAGLSGEPLGVRVVMLFGGIAVIGLGSGFYIGAALGAGPRDSLMLVLAQRTRFRIGVVRAGLEGCALVSGFALGGTVGLGTVSFALLIGPAVEASFWCLERAGLAHPSGVAVDLGDEPAY
jgi:uncharacterized membrane protein YczE